MKVRIWNKSRQGQDLVEMISRNQLVVANAFVQKEPNEITYTSGNNKTEIHLLIVTNSQLNKLTHCVKAYNESP